MPLPSSLSGREAVLDAARHHPFARLRAGGNAVSGFHVGREADIAGDNWSRYAVSDALVWKAAGRICGLGSPAAVVSLCEQLAAAGEIPPGALLEVPRVDISALSAFSIVRHEYWSILWTRQAHPLDEADHRVVSLPESEHAAIDSLLDVAFPATHNRTDSPLIRRWFGIYEEGQLVAVGADRSEHGIGYLVAIAVMPHRQGVGYGAALTRRIARELLAESDLCALGVTVANTRARALYQRMGFTEGIDLTSVRLA